MISLALMIVCESRFCSLTLAPPSTEGDKGHRGDVLERLAETTLAVALRPFTDSGESRS